MSKPCHLFDLDDGTDLTPPGPGFTLTPDDPLAGRLVALWAALRGRDHGEVITLVHELARIARDLPPAAPDALAEAEACAGAMEAWRDRRRDALLAAVERDGGVIDASPFGSPLLSEIQRDMRRAALDRLLKTGACTPGDLVAAYGFTPMQVFHFAAGVIAEARRLVETGAPKPEGEAA